LHLGYYYRLHYRQQHQHKTSATNGPSPTNSASHSHVLDSHDSQVEEALAGKEHLALLVH
jgi:hypothetical protein